MSVMINIMSIIICSVITFTSCSVDEKNNLSIRFPEDDLDEVLHDDDSEQNQIQQDGDIWKHLNDSEEQVEKGSVAQRNDYEIIKEKVLEGSANGQQFVIENVLEVEKLDDYLLNNSFYSVQGIVDHIAEKIVVEKMSEHGDILSKMSQKDLLKVYKIIFKTNLNDGQKEALEFLEKALDSKIDKLDKIFVLDEDEIKNMLDIISNNLNIIREFESSNEFIFDSDVLDVVEVVEFKSDDVRVEYAEVKSDLKGEIEPSLDDYLFVINAYFNDYDDIKVIVDNINSIKILSP
ncbi:Hypothetical protein BCD_1253 (plasmid) [Borrelia crocidurae DOU]|uniref:Uncharacterized protein n=1 Tax=Borrelia crocidurae DOU TaxID=1293575 RepID=W5SJL9_9SPIR|nr:hypothetical protein [Borrelia crocidurae]AHH07319.1 Hypothetical protein BCD_1253 [Borrelia crocidurae DOU]